MNKIISAVLLLIAVCTTVTVGQKRNQSVERKNADAQKVIRFMTDWTNLSNRHDIAGIKKILPADLILTFQDGEVQTRNEYLSALEKNPADFTVQNFDQKVSFFENSVAVICLRYEVTVGTSKTEFQNTTTFIRRRGRWQPIAFHSSPLIKK